MLTCDIVDDERDDRGLDDDAAPSGQCQWIGLGAALIDAADLVDHTGGEEQPRATRLRVVASGRQPFPAGLIYRRAQRHVAAIGEYFRLDPEL